MLSLRTLLRSSRSLITISQHGFKSVTTSKVDINGPLLAPICCSKASQQTFVAQQLRLYTSNSPNEIEDVRVYHGSLAPRMKAVKIFSLTTSLAGLAAQPILLEQGLHMGGKPLAVFLCGFAGLFTFVTPLLLHFITKKYVTEIHYNPKTEEYTATTISLLLFKIKTKFKPNDVKVPEVPGMFTSFLVHGKPLFVDPALFDDPDHYARIMGFDKPVDFKLDFTESLTKADNTNKKAQ